jgi:type II secretory pathway component PulJ
MKKSIVLLEVIISLILFSIIAMVSVKMVYSMVQKNTYDSFTVQNNLLLETTRLFLSKQNSLVELIKIDKSLYFENSLLLENISRYETSSLNKIITIDICIYDNKICQIWKIKG